MRSLTGGECKNRSDSAVCVRALRWMLLAETGDCIWQLKHKQQACDHFKGFWESPVVAATHRRESFHHVDHSCPVFTSIETGCTSSTEDRSQSYTGREVSAHVRNDPCHQA